MIPLSNSNKSDMAKGGKYNLTLLALYLDIKHSIMFLDQIVSTILLNFQIIHNN